MPPAPAHRGVAHPTLNRSRAEGFCRASKTGVLAPLHIVRPNEFLTGESHGLVCQLRATTANGQQRCMFCLVVDSQPGSSDEALLTRGDKTADPLLSKTPKMLDLGCFADAARSL